MKKFYLLLFFVCFQVSVLKAQRKDTFEEVKKRVSKTFFNTPDKAKNDAFQLKKMAQTNLEKVIALQYLGYIYDLTGKPDSARVYFEDRLSFTMKHFPKSIHEYQAVIDYCNWGVDYVDRTELVKILTRVLSTINVKKYRRETGLMNLLLGDVFLKDREVDKAAIYYEKSYKLIKDLKFAAADHFYRKSEIAIIKKDFKTAKKYLLQGLSSFKEKEIYTYPMYLSKLGYVAIMLNELELAKSYLFESLYYQQKNGFQELTSETYLNLAYLAQTKKDDTLEIYYLTKAEELNKGDVDVLKKIYLGLKEYYSKLNNRINERKYFEKFEQLNDSITHLEKQKVRTNLEYQFQKNESEKELALKEKIIQKDSRIKFLYFIGIGLLSILLTALFILYYYRIRTHKKLRKNQRLLHDEQLRLMQEEQRKEIIKEKVKVKLEERKKFSMELHDGIANELSALKLNITDENQLNKNEIKTILSKIDKLYQEVRHFSHELDPDNITDVEFSQLVNNLCELIENKGIVVEKNILITKKIDGLEESILVNLYRIFQEIIVNIIKHSQASVVQIEIYEDETELIMFIQDNGVGMTHEFKQKPGIGLKNIAKRVEILKGNYRFIDIKPGIAIEIRVPI